MPRQKKQHLKQRKDGRYCCKFQGIQFMGSTEDEALQAREAYKKAQLRGDIPRTSITVAEFALPWLERTKIGVAYTTYATSATLLEKLLNHVGGKPFPEVLPSDIKSVYSSEFLSFSDSYIHKAEILYRSLFDAAVADGLCRVNPARDKSARPHKGTKGSHRVLTSQERIWVTTLCTNHRCYPAVMAMLYEGLRPPEAKALDIDKSVDLKAGTVTVCEFVHKVDSNRYIINSKGKTDLSTRVIPLMPQFAAAISGKSGKLVKPVKAEELSIRAWTTLWKSYVNCMEAAINGMQHRWYRRTKEHKKILAEAAALRDAGKLEEAANKENEIPAWIPFTVRPYDLRHTFCTLCRDAGVEIHTCIQWMGHTDASMILKIYDEVSVDRSKSEAEKLKKSLIGMHNGMQTKTYRLKRSKIKASKQ